MFQTFQLFFDWTAVHVRHFHLFLIRAVDIFQWFCKAVAIRAVAHFGLKNAFARQDMYGILFWFLSRCIYFCHLLKQCRAIEILVSSSFFEQMNFEQMTLLEKKIKMRTINKFWDGLIVKMRNVFIYTDWSTDTYISKN
jgi:hypothetical protein